MQPKEQNIVDDHRNMLSVSKKISDFQENNLKSWAHIVFNDIEKVKIKYDFINKEDEFYAGTIVYDFTFKEGKEPDSHRKTKALEDLTRWTQVLFWTDTKVVFKNKGKKWT